MKYSYSKYISLSIRGLVLLVASQLAIAGDFSPMTALSDEELSDITGQSGLIDYQKIQGDGGDNGDADMTFSRLTFNVELETILTVDEIVLGEYAIPCDPTGGLGLLDNTSGNINRDCLGADIKISNAALGCLEDCYGLGNNDPDTFKATRPFVELAWKEVDGKKTIAGLRLGFHNVDGVLGGLLESISGDLVGRGTLLWDGVEVGYGTLHAPRGNTMRVDLIEGGPFSLGDFWGLDLAQQVGLDNTKNFFIGMQTRAVNYPKVTPGAPQNTAQRGYWLNMQSGVQLALSQLLLGQLVDNPVDACWGSDGGTPCYR